MFTAIVVAMVLLYGASASACLDMSQVWINPTWHRAWSAADRGSALSSAAAALVAGAATARSRDVLSGGFVGVPVRRDKYLLTTGIPQATSVG
jgi:hypothetical protein